MYQLGTVWKFNLHSFDHWICLTRRVPNSSFGVIAELLWNDLASFRYRSYAFCFVLIFCNLHSILNSCFLQLILNSTISIFHLRSHERHFPSIKNSPFWFCVWIYAIYCQLLTIYFCLWILTDAIYLKIERSLFSAAFEIASHSSAVTSRFPFHTIFAIWSPYWNLIFYISSYWKTRRDRNNGRNN